MRQREWHRTRRYVLAALGADRTPRTAEQLTTEAEGRYQLKVVRRVLQVTTEQGLTRSIRSAGDVDLEVWLLTARGVDLADQARRQAEARQAHRDERTSTS